MSEEGEIWRDYKEEQQARRLKRLPIRTRQIIGLKESGFTVRQLTPYQFRINENIDVFPIHNRFHDIKKNRRGGYKDINLFVSKYKNL